MVGIASRIGFAAALAIYVQVIGTWVNAKGVAWFAVTSPSWLLAVLLRTWVGRAVYLVPMVAVGESIRRSDDDMNLAGLVFAMYLPALCMLVVLVELSVYVLRHP